jgi:hypothetical protein
LQQKGVGAPQGAAPHAAAPLLPDDEDDEAPEVVLAAEPAVPEVAAELAVVEAALALPLVELPEDAFVVDVLAVDVLVTAEMLLPVELVLLEATVAEVLPELIPIADDPEEPRLPVEAALDTVLDDALVRATQTPASTLQTAELSQSPSLEQVGRLSRQPDAARAIPTARSSRLMIHLPNRRARGRCLPLR